MNNITKQQPQQTQSNVNILKYIYDEEFIGLINSLSNSIKDYNKNTRHFLNNINLNTSSLNEQTLFAKSALNDIMLYLNQTIKLKLNPKTNDKYFRDKLALINERLDRITELRNNITFDFSNTQKALNDFYEYAKEIFRKMRVVRNQKIEEINSKINFDNYTNKANAVDAESNSGNNNNNNSTIAKKNEKLISEIAVIKFKYDEIVKENEKLKAMLKLNNNTNDFSTNISINNSNNNSIRKRNLSLGITRNVPKMHTVHNSVNNSVMNSSSSTPKHNTLLYSSYNTITGSSDNKSASKKQVKGVSITSIKKSFNIDQDNTKQRNASASSALSSAMNKAISNKKQRYNRNPQRNNNNNISTIPISNSTCSGNSGNNMLTVSTQSNHSASEIIQGTAIPTTNLNTNSNKTMNTTAQNNKTALNTSSNSNNNSFCNHATPNATNANTTSLANSVLSFLTHMKTLQDSISSKAANVKEMKRSFEIKKKELKKSAETILGISSSITTSSQLITMANNSLNNSPRDKKTYNNMSTSTNSLFPSNEMNVTVVSNLNKEITELKAELIVKEEKLKNEKSISKVCEETLTNEKIKNKTLNDEISTLQSTNATLLTEVSALKSEIAKLKMTITECNSNIITISNTNESIIKEKEIQITNLNKDNRELKNKIAQIKNDFITHHDEEMEILKLKLIEINNDAATSLLQIQSSQQLNDTSATLKEIHSSTSDYLNTIELIKQYREDIEKVNSVLEKRIINSTNALSSNRNTYIVSSNRNNNNPNKTLSNINEQNSNFIDDELSSVSGIFLEEKKETTDRKTEQGQIISPTLVGNEPCSNIGNFDMQLQNNIKLLEDNEMLLRNQLELLKIEIKKTREERDELKKQIQHNENNCCFLKGPENEIMLKQTFEKLVECLQVTGKAKEYIIMMLRLMTYSEDDIQRVINKKDKKKFG